jgi:Ca2+-transporting ATPase
MMQLAVLATPAIRNIFKVRLLTPSEIGIVLLCTISPLILVEIGKLIKKQA